MKCPAITRKGNECPIKGEARRNGYCHVHDPKGKYQQQQSARKAKRKQVLHHRKEERDKYQAKRKARKRRRELQKYNKKNYGKKLRGTNSEVLENGAGYVYLFSLGFDDLYKIGKSRAWMQRINAFLSANPKMRPIAVIEVADMSAAEKTLHKFYKRYRKTREIFFFEDTKHVIVEMGRIGKLRSVREWYK